MADLFHALAYYYDNREDFTEREREAAARRQEGERRTREIVGRDAEVTDQGD